MIIAKNLTKVYKTGGKEVKALNNVNFVLPDNGMIFIVGKSGSGKSTLLNMISGLDKITSGQVISGGNSVGTMTARMKEKYLSSYIGYVFQDYRLIEDFTVRQNVALAADISAPDEDPDKYLKLVGLSGYEDRLPRELSGGQKQRVAIARALIKRPKVILADEPTGNLDAATTEEVLKLLRAVSKNTLVVIVSHNLRDAETYADRILELSDGRLISDISRIVGYKNDFSVKGGVINLPHHKDLNQDEITALIKNGRGASKIIQSGGGFAPTTPLTPNNTRDTLYNKHMSLGNKLKIFGIFFKRKFASKLATIVMAAVILSVFYVIQALTLYDTSTAIINTLVNSNSPGVIVQASVGSESADKYVGRLPEDKIARLDEAYDGEYYRLYSEFMYTNPSGGGESYVTSKENTIAYYAKITSGTLHTTEGYAAKLLGAPELEYLAVAPEQKDYGVVITDYTADSIIARYKLADITNPGKYPVYETYEELLGERSVAGEKTYINAIVNTNYEEEHAEIKNVLLSLGIDSDLGALVADMRYINFVADLEERYNIAYAFAENYPEALREYLVSSGSYMRFSAFAIDETRYSSSLSLVIVKRDSVKMSATGETYELADGEVIMGYNIYNKIFTQSVTQAEAGTADFVKNFKHSRPLGFAHYESNAVKEIANRVDNITIKNLTATSNVLYMNENTYRDFMKLNTYTYSVYLDNPEAARAVMPLVEEMNLSIFSGKIGNVHFIQRCIGIFEDFFGVTMGIILLACAIFLINFGIKSIRSSIYEIGVIKAMGGIKRDISMIFISQSLLIGVGILFGTYIGMQVAAFTANAVFLKSLELVVNSNFYGIEAIDFYPLVALIDIFVALVVVVISAIISNKTIDRLNLISILKAKE
jgi:ABC-type lipoprotein export system ATPase subunit/ABC-type lipoprotein release transport system permease subunit